MKSSKQKSSNRVQECFVLVYDALEDPSTEQTILKNVRENYPGITLLSVTQKIASVTDYDQIIVLIGLVDVHAHYQGDYTQQAQTGQQDDFQADGQ